MILRNTSRYPEAEVRALVAAGMRGVNTAGVAVHVKNNGRGAYRGYAYDGVPAISPMARDPRVRHLVTLRIGPPERFPTSNGSSSVRWSPWLPAETPRPADYPDRSRYRLCRYPSGSPELAAARSRRAAGIGYDEISYGRTERHPYGGKRSPAVTLADWREALVFAAAHEARHLYQFVHRKRRSEVDAERHAARRLAAWRSEQGDAVEEAG